MMENVEIITLEDNNDYIVTKEIIIDNVKYVYLTKSDDVASFCIRKINIINDEEFLVGLNDKDEFLKALKSFTEEVKSS